MAPSMNKTQPDMMNLKSSDRTVLVVDDDVHNAQVLAETLKSDGFNVIVAYTVSRAAQLAANQRFFCMVVDMFVGPERGSRLVRQIRGNKADVNHSTPIVAVSGAFDPGTVAEVRGMVNAAMVKPFRPRDLIEVLRRVTSAGGEVEGDEGTGNGAGSESEPGPENNAEIESALGGALGDADGGDAEDGDDEENFSDDSGMEDRQAA